MSHGRILCGQRPVGTGEQHRHRLKSDILRDVIAVRAGCQVAYLILSTSQTYEIVVILTCAFQLIQSESISIK